MIDAELAVAEVDDVGITRPLAAFLAAGKGQIDLEVAAMELVVARHERTA